MTIRLSQPMKFFVPVLCSLCYKKYWNTKGTKHQNGH